FSDNGNVFKATNGTTPGAPYYKGRWSNGPVWVELVANSFSSKLYDFAFGGAVANLTDIPEDQRKALSSIPDLDGQLGLFKKSGVQTILKPESTLYTVFAGGNDYLDDIKEGVTPDVKLVASNFLYFLDELISTTSAQQIVILNIPPLESVPFVFSQVPAAALPGIAQIGTAHNQILTAGLKALAQKYPSTNIYDGDLFGLVKYMISTDGAANLGYTNVNASCVDKSKGTVCANPDEYVFWDGLHPTERSHTLLAKLAVDIVNGVDDIASYTSVPATQTDTSATYTDSGNGYTPTPTDTTYVGGYNTTSSNIIYSGAGKIAGMSAFGAAILAVVASLMF
ncbi:hypothetical protein HDU76_001153, partial [Blyttiomyces sp. JEL0837]